MAISAQIKPLLEEALRELIFSGYGFYAERVAGGRQSILEAYGGVTSYWPGARPVDQHSRFDIGSITKTLCTTSLFARGVMNGQVRLEDRVEAVDPTWKGSPYGQLTLDELLGHHSGLVGWFPLFRKLRNQSLQQFFLSHSDELVAFAPRSKAVYSDFGFMLLGQLAEHLWGPLDRAFAEQIARPLGLTDVGFGPLADRTVAVATEFSLSRRILLQGEVFDENCRALGGVAGHAGLFSSVGGVVPWCREWMQAIKGQSGWLSQNIALAFTRPAGHIPGSSWARGWDGKSVAHSTAGDLFSQSSFGTLGYPGCSIWCDPERDGFFILFTNRVHPSRVDERIRALRPRIHDAVARAWDNVRGGDGVTG